MCDALCRFSTHTVQQGQLRQLSSVASGANVHDGENYHIPACGSAAGANDKDNMCAALCDFSVSTVSLAADAAIGRNANPTDPFVIVSQSSAVNVQSLT